MSISETELREAVAQGVTASDVALIWLATAREGQSH
jgi:hypothetical protein